MRAKSAISTIGDGYFRVLEFAIVACLAAMVVLVFGNVVLRYAFNESITVSEELSRWLFVYMTFLGALVAMREHAHLGVDSLVKRLSPTGRRACAIACQLLMLYVTVLFLQGSWKQTVINLAVQAPASGFSMAIFYGVGVVFSVSALAILAGQLWRTVSGRASGDELVMVKESEEHAEIAALNLGPPRIDPKAPR